MVSRRPGLRVIWAMVVVGAALPSAAAGCSSFGSDDPAAAPDASYADGSVAHDDAGPPSDDAGPLVDGALADVTLDIAECKAWDPRHSATYDAVAPGRTGGSACRLCRGGEDSPPFVRKTVPLMPAADYRINAWIRSADVMSTSPVGGDIGFQFYGVDGGVLDAVGIKLTPGAAWTQTTADRAAPAGTTNVYATIAISAAVGQCFDVDDVSIVTGL
ncbi:MAG: hypothetical protein JWP97_4045 [Labilithrix sp.]|nr:hypothetical protein [Labilithrix sp.]